MELMALKVILVKKEKLVIQVPLVLQEQPEPME